MTAENRTPAPHSVKQWHLESLGSNRSSNQTTEMLHTRFSSWTPHENQSLNEQLFQERVRLISHWFDMWTDKQRKQFLHWILLKCSTSQLKFVGKWFTENTPVIKADFTSLLPRFISLYIFSFLSPKDLCAGAQVSWHWKFLTEQDCLWMPKCVRFGWFLPYSPAQNEYSAWKRHYIACAIHLDVSAPKETYEALKEAQTENAEQKERMYEKRQQKIIRERLALHKKELLKMRPPWLSGTQNSTFFKSGFRPYLSQIIHAGSPEASLLMKKRMSSNYIPLEQVIKEVKSVPNLSLATERHFVLASLKSLPKRKNVAGSDCYPVLSHKHCLTVSQRNADIRHLQPHLVLISSQVPGYEMIVDSVKPGVIPVVYEHCSTTLESLFYYVEKELDSRRAKSIGIVSDGDSRGINLLRGCRISTKDLLNPEVREFWKKLGSCVTSQQEDGHIDIFLPLAASEAGMELLSQLSCLTGAFFRTPTGVATGSYQHIFSEWLGNEKDNPPPSLYFTEAKLQVWLRLTEFLEDTLKTVRKQLRPHLYDLQKKMTGKIIGQIVFDAMSWSEVQDNQAIAEALTDGLIELSRGNYENPLEFLSHFLVKKHSKNKELRNPVFLTECNPEASSAPSIKNGKHQNTPEKRERFARELLISEKNYVHVLEILRDVYTKPLRAALASNRPILSHANVQIIFSDILDILQLNRWFLAELTQRLEEWSPAQNLGDIFVKFGQKFQAYTNFYNNYAVILKTIDQCRETIPLFRAFLKRHDKTVVTGMRSLQELLLCPSKRLEEYIALLYALRLHTRGEHPGRGDLTSAIQHMHRYKDFINQLKQYVNRDDQMLTTQRLIQGCPQLLKANRYLIRTQDVAQLRCCSEKVSAPYRLYEHVYDLSLFLFNDILVIAQRSISHKPFEWSSKVTHQFLEVVALHQLFVEDIPESKYIKNAFLLQGPRHQFICSTEETDKFPWLSTLQRAIICDIEENEDIY